MTEQKAFTDGGNYKKYIDGVNKFLNKVGSSEFGCSRYWLGKAKSNFTSALKLAHKYFSGTLDKDIAYELSELEEKLSELERTIEVENAKVG